MYDSWEPSDTCLTFCSLATSIGTQRWSENPIERKHQLIGNHIVCEDSHWMAPSLAGHEIQQSAGSFNEIVRSRKFISTTVAAIAHACCWWVLRVSWSGYISVVQAWHEQVKWAPYSPRWQLECLAVVAIIPKHDFGRCSPVLQVLPSNIQKIFGLDHYFVTFWIAESNMFGRRIGGIKLLNTISLPVAGTSHCRLPWTRTHAIQCWDSVRKPWTNVTTPLLCRDAHVHASDG